MISRKLLKLLTLTSFLPLASCATPDENPEGANASPLNAPNPAAFGNENLNESIDDALEANDADNLEGWNELDAADGEDNLLGETEDEDSMELGDSDFDEFNDMDSMNGNLAEAATGSPAADAGAAIDSFENDLMEENFLEDPAPSTALAEGNPITVPSDEGLDSFKNSPPEQDAFAEMATEDLLADPTLQASNTAAVNAVADAVVEAPPATPAAPPPVAAPPVVAQDVDATPSTLRWVGYRINETMKKLNIEFVTEGRPEYEILESVNRSNQNELIFRFYHTKLRKKIKWDVNSSEFRSPVAYIRMRDREAEGIVDLVITHRDKIQPGFFEKKGNFILSYDIPERYFNELDLAQKAKVKDKAVSLSAGEPSPLATRRAVPSKLPVVGTPRYVTSFREPPKFEPIRNFIAPKRIKNSKDGFPESFDKTLMRGRRTGEIVSRRTLFGVAQDNLENDFANENWNNFNNNSGNNFNNNAGNNLNNNTGGNFNNTGNENWNNFNNNSGNNFGNENWNENFNNNSGNNLGNENWNANFGNNTGNNFGNNLESDTGSNFDDGFGNEAGFNQAADPAAFENLSNQVPLNAANADPLSISPEANGGNPAGAEATSVQVTPGEDIEPDNAGGPRTKYSGKPIFMEFYDSPLSLVLKGFQEETGNNFVFPAEVAEIPVTIQFRGVPWDEALKAILETYSLGMVRIGDNVVRVDRIASLTGYMQALEQATQFESRRVPTKVMVFRMNNGVAKDVATRIAALLARDIELDNRIKLSDDERTNSIVIEAPMAVLAKAKAIIERLDLDTPQVEIMARIVEVQKNDSDFTGVAWGNNINFDPGRALGFGTLNFPNSAKSAFSVDPGVAAAPGIAGSGTLRLGSLNKFLDLDLFLKLEEKRSNTNVLQSQRLLVLDGQKAEVTAGSSQFFRPAAGGNVINPAPGAGGAGGGGEANGLSEITFNLSLEVTPQVTALGNVIMSLDIASDTPGDTSGEALATKGTRRISTQMVRASGDTGVIGGIYDTKRTTSVTGVPFLSDLPIIGALFRSTQTTDSQTELLIMVTPTILSGGNQGTETASSNPEQSMILSKQKNGKKGAL